MTDRKKENLEIAINEERNYLNNNEKIIDIIKDNSPQQKGINFQNDNININLENSSQNNSSNDINKIIKNNNEKKNENYNNTLCKTPSSVFQEKLKNIFLEREKAKLKYNKQSIPEKLKYNSDDDDSNMSKEIIKTDINENKNINSNINIYNEKKSVKINEKEEKIENNNNINENELNDNKNEIKEIVNKKENLIIDNIENNKKYKKEKIYNKTETCNNENDKIEVKTFRRRFNYLINEDENKGRNSYQMLLSKKIKNIADDDDDEEDNNKKNSNNNIKKEKEEAQVENNKNIQLDIKEEKPKEIKENKNDNKNFENQTTKEENKEKEKEKEKINEKIEINKREKEKVEDKRNNKKEMNINLEIKTEIKNIESDKDTKYSTYRNSGVIQLNQNIINIEKNNSEIEEKGTQIPTPQKNKLTINIKSSGNKKKYNINNDILSPIFSPRELKMHKEQPKTINRYELNSKTIKEDSNNKSNIIKLLQLIKNKKNEREQIDKEKEKAKEEMFKRSKSEAFSHNLESNHKIKKNSKEEEESKNEEKYYQNKDINNKSNLKNNNKIEVNQNEVLKSPKQEIYKKNKIKYVTNCKAKENNNINININNLQNCSINNMTSPKSQNISKTNSQIWSSNKGKNMDRIVVNHRMKTNTNKGNININTNNINNIKNNNSFKDIINRFAISNIGKNKKIENEKEKYNEMDINIKKTYEKPVFIYNKQHLQNKSVDIENIDSPKYLSNNLNKKKTLKKIANYNFNSLKVYNPKKKLDERGKSVEKHHNENINNKMNKEYYKEYYTNYTNNNYIYNYNYNNFNNNNNNGLNNIYVRKKSFLFENKAEQNTSSSNFSNSINNKDKNQKYYSKNNFKKENMRVYPNFYSMLPPKENTNRKINLKVNKKSFYLNDNEQNHNNENFNESTDIIGRSYISDKKYVYKKTYYNNDKSYDKYDSFISKKSNNILRSLNDNNNNNQKIIGIQKNIKNRRDILMEYDCEENNKSMNNIHNFKDYYNTNTQRKNNEIKKFNLFKIDDLLVIEEKLNIIIDCLKNNKEINKQCFDFWNYFFNCSIFKKIEKIFSEEKDINIIKLSINYELMSLIICYEYSLDLDIYMEINIKLLEMMELNYNNLMALFQQFLINFRDYIFESDWIKKVSNIYENYSKKEDFFVYNKEPIDKIINNNQKLMIKIQNLLNYYQTENISLLINYFLQIKTKTYEDLNNFFQKNILQIENKEGSLVASLYLRNNTIFSPIPPPYIKIQSNKKYTLVLDLDETLVNFKIKKGREGYVRLRPFLFGFLEEVSQFYELIIFTSATEAYANSVIEAIEHDKKYFDYVFYRQHTIIVGNEFVKDLTRIGRPLNSTIIIDNMPQNFRFQKENGISIKPFWGQDFNDKTLYDLMPILLDIAKNGGDVRLSLNKYKDEIVGKITSNISKNK